MTLRAHFRQLGKARKGGRFIGFNKQRSMRQTQPEGTQFGGELAVKNGQVPGRGGFSEPVVPSRAFAPIQVE